MTVTPANLNDLKDATYRLLCSIPEMAMKDYLYAKLNLYKLLKGDAKLLKRLEENGQTIEEFQEKTIARMEDAKDLFMREDLKALYKDLSATQALEALDRRFTEEVIPTYERTGNWFYTSIFLLDDENED